MARSADVFVEPDVVDSLLDDVADRWQIAADSDDHDAPRQNKRKLRPYRRAGPALDNIKVFVHGHLRGAHGPRTSTSCHVVCTDTDTDFRPINTFAAMKTELLNNTVKYRVCQKIASFFAHLIVSPNINRFSTFFHRQNQKTICNKTITIDPTTPQMCKG